MCACRIPARRTPQAGAPQASASPARCKRHRYRRRVRLCPLRAFLARIPQALRRKSVEYSKVLSHPFGRPAEAIATGTVELRSADRLGLSVRAYRIQCNAHGRDGRGYRCRITPDWLDKRCRCPEGPVSTVWKHSGCGLWWDQGQNCLARLLDRPNTLGQSMGLFACRYSGVSGLGFCPNSGHSSVHIAGRGGYESKSHGPNATNSLGVGHASAAAGACR
jgi:hypothetical protein